MGGCQRFPTNAWADQGPRLFCTDFMSIMRSLWICLWCSDEMRNLTVFQSFTGEEFCFQQQIKSRTHAINIAWDWTNFDLTTASTKRVEHNEIKNNRIIDGEAIYLVLTYEDIASMLICGFEWILRGLHPRKFYKPRPNTHTHTNIYIWICVYIVWGRQYRLVYISILRHKYRININHLRSSYGPSSGHAYKLLNIKRKGRLRAYDLE